MFCLVQHSRSRCGFGALFRQWMQKPFKPFNGSQKPESWRSELENESCRLKWLSNGYWGLHLILPKVKMRERDIFLLFYFTFQWLSKHYLLHTVCIRDLDKLKLVLAVWFQTKLEPTFTTAPWCLQNTAHLKNVQKWPKNNNHTSFIKVNS